MKHAIYPLCAAFQLATLFSCSNETIFEEELTIKTNKALARRALDCYGCLPMLTVYHDEQFNEFVIAWSGFIANPKEHSVTISYEIEGMPSESQQIVYANGEIRKKVEVSAYSIKWSIKCSSTRHQCSACHDSGRMVKKESGETEIVPYENCGKEYLSYSLEKVSDKTYDLVLNDPYGNRYNTDDYLTIDQIKLYSIDQDTHYEGELALGLTVDKSSAPDRIRLYITHQDIPYKSFKLKFYSSKCEYNKDHYLYVTYAFDGLGNISIPSYLQSVKHREQ